MITETEYTPEEELVRKGLAISERSLTLTLLAGFFFTAGTVISLIGIIALAGPDAELANSSALGQALGIGLIASAPFIFVAGYFGWRHELAFRNEHPDAYRAGQNKLKGLTNELPPWKRSIFTHDQYGDKIEHKEKDNEQV